MSSVWKAISHFLFDKSQTSESAKRIASVFEEPSTNGEFFKHVINCFEMYDMSNQNHHNPYFKNDVKYLIEFGTERLRSPGYCTLFPQRVDAYLYIHCRLWEYSHMAHQPYDLFMEFQTTLYDQLCYLFHSNGGNQPNLGIINPDLIKRIDIQGWIPELEVKDKRTLCIFFVLCKLSFQASLKLYGESRLKWTDLISRINKWSISLTVFITEYEKYRCVYDCFPVDIDALIYLARKSFYLENRHSPIHLLHSYLLKLNLSPDEFYYRFLPLFADGMRSKYFSFSQILILLKILSAHETLFEKYWLKYAQYVSHDDVWKMFLELSKKVDKIETVKQHLIECLTVQTSNVSFETFKELVSLFKNYQNEIPETNCSHALQIIEEVWNSFINKQLNDGSSSHKYSETDLKELLNIYLNLFNKQSFQQPSCLLIVQHLLFKNHPNLPPTSNKMLCLFEDLNKFDKNFQQANDLAKLIQDEWLNNYILYFPNDWRTLEKHQYQVLCDICAENSWSTDVWAKLVQLSILKSNISKPEEVISQLSQWLTDVGHDSYNSNDKMTIILVKYVFEEIIMKHVKQIFSFSNSRVIIKYIQDAKVEACPIIDKNLVDQFIQMAQTSIKDILLLNGKFRLKANFDMNLSSIGEDVHFPLGPCNTYNQLSKSSIIYHFVEEVDFKNILSSIDPLNYKFPIVKEDIKLLVSIQQPTNVDLEHVNSKDEYLDCFIKTIQSWLQWFNRFIDIFQYILEVFKIYKMNGIEQLLNEFHIIRRDPNVAVIRVKTVVQQTLKFLKPFDNLCRLCDLFNCLNNSQIVSTSSLLNSEKHQSFLAELKQWYPSNKFKSARKTIERKTFAIHDRRHVQWAIASTKDVCNIVVEYKMNISNNLLYKGNNVGLDKQVLQGEFKTQPGGEFQITIDNRNNDNDQMFWYRLTQTNLSTYHIFHGVYNMYYQKYFSQVNEFIEENDLNQLIVRVFCFIDKLLDGNVTINEMNCLKAVFHDKNINVRNEAEKLFENRFIANKERENSTTQNIDQLCQWLQTYQYYSYTTSIIDCIRKFQIVSNCNSIDKLEHVTLNEDCSLRQICEVYQDLYQRFQNLTNHHLQLIKTISECSNVIQLMKNADLYSKNGLRRFQQLRDNLTTQFQFQEKNNLILNSWIIAYALCEPFAIQVENIEEFIEKFSRLSNIDESSLEHIKIINDNLQVVNMWLSAAETTMLDNAIVTMEHLYQTGVVKMHLNHLMGQKSYFEIVYTVDKDIEKESEENKKELKFTLSMNDIEDYKRQLTFCYSDLEQHGNYKTVLLNEQIKLLHVFEKIYLILVQLELSGHPYYQLKEKTFEIYDPFGRIKNVLLNLKLNKDFDGDFIEETFKNRTNDMKLVYRNLETTYSMWKNSFQISRHEYRLLKLFSNRQIMIMIILLTTTTVENEIQKKFFKKICQPLNRKNSKYDVNILLHYLQLLQIKNSQLSFEQISDLYKKHKIQYGTPADKCLQQLGQFLNEFFDNGNDLFSNDTTNNENQQYLVELKSSDTDFNVNMCSILLRIFNDRLPADYQILWCLSTSEDDIELFFSRVRIFRSLTFAVMDIDKMDHRLREILLYEQSLLTKESESHAPIYYFSRESYLYRKGLRLFYVEPILRDPLETMSHLRTLNERNGFPLPNIDIIYGMSGIGKTHRIKTEYSTFKPLCISLNDHVDLSSLISSFLSFDWQRLNEQTVVYFNISITAPFQQLNRLFFSLFICRSLSDHSSGLAFSLSMKKSWRFVIEVPYQDTPHLTVEENFREILPILSIVPSNKLEQVTDRNYQLFIDIEEEIVARFLKAFDDKSIDSYLIVYSNGTEKPVEFPRLTDHNECRQYIYDIMQKYAPNLPRNKITELSFTRFLYRRVQFFNSFYYQYNISIERLGSIAMQQMIREAKYLTQIDFSANDYLKVYLVYDPDFSLHLLHSNWNDVPNDLKFLFHNRRPHIEVEYKNKDYFPKCLSWLLNISLEKFNRVIEDTNFILTKSFAYKLFHVHERKLTKLPLIIEGETGVGKTFLLKFYSKLLNVNLICGNVENYFTPRIVERTSLWMLKTILNKIIKSDEELLVECLQEINDTKNADEVLQDIEYSLKSFEYDKPMLQNLWKIFLTETTNEEKHEMNERLRNELCNFIELQADECPLFQYSNRLFKLLADQNNLTNELSSEMFTELIFHTETKELFYRLLIHPGITEQYIETFLSPIIKLAEQIPEIELIVFFDEVNTSSCLGLFKEMFMDGTLRGVILPKNIFFTAAINPRKTSTDNFEIHRSDYLVHELPSALKNLVVSYGTLDSHTLEDCIQQKIARFTITSMYDQTTRSPLEQYVQFMFAQSILSAQKFCEQRLGANSVSQREIQRCFNLIDFFSTLKYDDTNGDNSDPQRCITLALAVIYYFRLPTKEDNLQRDDKKTPSREELAEILSHNIPDFAETIQNELEQFVNIDNFVIPHGVAVNQAIREHIFAIVVSIVTRTPLCIIGAPGQSKTLSFQIVLQNLQGSELSTKSFCKRLPAIDPFFCLGSKYSRSEDIASVFDRAIEREQHYRQNRIDRRCVVFLDEASLPDERKMVLKVLHPYLDECKVAFVAVANRSFDAANANRMICIYRSLPSKEDQLVLAYGCLGLIKSNQTTMLHNIVYGLCQGYQKLLKSENIPKIFHDRDFIYMLRELRFELPSINDDYETIMNIIQPINLLRALEDNFNGIEVNEFRELVGIVFKAVQERLPNFGVPKEKDFRDTLAILQQSMKLDSQRRRLYGRYKLIIDESEDESAVHLLFETDIFDSSLNKPMIFRISDFSNDINNELRHVEILTQIKLCMETGKTILMINTSRIHGSLYDVFNQNFSIMATGDTRKILSKVAIGSKTVDVVVHEDFQCIVYVKRSEFKDIPAPFLSRFQKYSVSVKDFYRIQSRKLPASEQNKLKSIELKAQSFIRHFGREYFYGLNDNTLYSCLLPLIKQNEDHGDHHLLNTSQCYTQLTIHLKSFIEQHSTDIQQCYLRLILSKLIQLVTPESIIVKLPTFENNVGRWLCNLYFEQQEHFNIENFIHKLTSEPAIIKKIMIFTRTSSYVTRLNDTTIFNNKKIEILNLSIIQSSIQLNEKLNDFQQNQRKNLLITVIDGRNEQQCLHISFVRQLIDRIENSSNKIDPPDSKYYVVLIHLPSQNIYHQTCFPAVFFYGWDYHYFDTCISNRAFRIQKVLKMLSSPYDAHQSDSFDDDLCDISILFDDSLWNFCSRIQILLPSVSQGTFSDKRIYEFYQRTTNTMRRVKCLQGIFEEATYLQKYILQLYHARVLHQKKSTKTIYKLIYQISKDILCNKRFDGLMNSIQLQTQNTFTNFVSHTLKYITNDYGLEALQNQSIESNNYWSLLNLIDYQSFEISDSIKSTRQEIFQLTTNYSCVPKTPLFHLLNQRIQKHADQIRLNQILSRKSEGEQYFIDGNFEYNNLAFERFRYELLQSIEKDKVLSDIICKDILHLYSADIIRTHCSIVENNFKNSPMESLKAVEFLKRWLLLIEENDHQILNDHSNKPLWLLVHVYSSFKYEQNDLLSMYSICRISDSIELSYTNLYNDENLTRKKIREQLFRLVFDCLWEKLNRICSNSNQRYETWVDAHTFIMKYYPSGNVLRASQLFDIECRIEFMNLAYLIYLNDNLLEPNSLIKDLLKAIRFEQQTTCLRFLPSIINIVDKYQNSALVVDLLQWTLSILRSSSKMDSMKEIFILLKYLNESNCQIPFQTKKFLFDELISFILKFKYPNKQTFDLWDRFDLIPFILLECFTNLDELENYQLIYHPSLLSTMNEQTISNMILIDLLFNHMKTQLTHEIMSSKLVNKGMLLKMAKIENTHHAEIIEKIYQQFRKYFLITIVASLLCQTDLNQEETNRIYSVLPHLIDLQSTEINNDLHLFLSIIIRRKSWNFLLNLLNSEPIKQIHDRWPQNLFNLLNVKHVENQSKYLQKYHQIQFTISSKNISSIFPHLHQPYEELREIIQDSDDQWNTLSNWIKLKLISDQNVLQINEIKVLLLLIIYYEYYCNNDLSSITTMFSALENHLDLSNEELRVFQAFLEPSRYMVGYSLEKNSLNDLFKLDCDNEFDLSLRHMLVNLLAMIILGGTNSFLWTFAFKPTSLQNTFGFGSTSKTRIERNGVHYDCGCILSKDGDLLRFDNVGDTSLLGVPAIYAVYYSTFGALAWHLLLYRDSTNNLNGPILSSSAINDNMPDYHLQGDSVRTKTCHFVYTRLFSTYHFLSIQFNESDACLILTRCFEQMAYLTIRNEHWIKKTYRTIEQQYLAENEYHNKVFYFVHTKLIHYKNYINELDLESHIQRTLQNFVDQMPIQVQFNHFKSELNNAIASQRSLFILQHIFNSLEFFKQSNSIYKLSRFYLLLHQTYTQLIEKDEFSTITLKDLHLRQFQNETQIIIDQGIEAVNKYHRFAHGFIRPGACDQTQRFTEISLDTPVNYLVTNENHDEGDIIMRILSVLINHHNKTLELIERELKNDENSMNNNLKNLIYRFITKEISIVQISNDNTGLVTLTDDDCSWIEKLSEGNLISNEKHVFVTGDRSKLNFDFHYVQSQVLRKYFLVYRINYHHIIQKYQCHTKKIEKKTRDDEDLELDEKYSIRLTDFQIENEWNDLKSMPLDKLYHGHQLLRHVALTLKADSNDQSSNDLYTFVSNCENGNDLQQLREKNEIKNFGLCYIDHVIQLYLQSMNDFHYLFTDIPHLLQMPIEKNLNDELFQQVNDNNVNNNLDEIQLNIQMITDFLQELKTIEQQLLEQSNHSLKEICQFLSIENPIVSQIPNGIKCENYVDLNIHLIRVRSNLQIRKLNIEEKEKKLWDDSFDMSQPTTIQSPNLFHQCLQVEDDCPVSTNWMSSKFDLEYSNNDETFLKLNVTFVPWTTATLLQEIQQYRNEPTEEKNNLGKAQKITIIHPNKVAKTYLWKLGNFLEQYEKLLNQNKYDQNEYDLIDNDEIAANTSKANSRLSFCTQYSILRKQDLHHIQFEFREEIYEYRVTSKCNIKTLVYRFIDDNQLKSSLLSGNLCFFDRYGKVVGDQWNFDSENESIRVTEDISNTDDLCKLLLQYDRSLDFSQDQSYLFHPKTTWRQINLWLKTFPKFPNLSLDDYTFYIRDHKTIMDYNDMIDSRKSMTFDILNQHMIAKIVLSDSNTTSRCIYVLKSMKLLSLLQEENISLDSCILRLQGENESILNDDDFDNSIGTYLSDTYESSIHLRITTSIEIIKYDTNELIRIPILNPTMTFEQILISARKSNNAYNYLALVDSKRIIDANEIYVNVNQTKFLLLKDDETCLVSINKSDDNDKSNQKYQRYARCATTMDVYKDNLLDVSNQYLSFAYDFIPSSSVPLSFYFRTELSSIDLVTFDHDLPVVVTVESRISGQTIKFRCLHSATIERLRSIACQLFGLNNENYQFELTDSTSIDDGLTLEDIDATMTNIEFELTPFP